ncbi:MAG: alpha/beta hydrolase [Eubacterium sp.]|nr:alpha/beta hydrolase [Eubacterium sp.]
MCRKLADGAEACVINVEYPLSPEVKFPREKEQTYDVVSYVYHHPEEFKIDNQAMAVCGYSAGANIAAVVAMMAKEEGEFTFRCQALNYPPTDIATSAYDKFYTEGAIPRDIATLFDACYRLPEQAKDPHCSPLFADIEDLKGLPPAIVLTCEIDSLRDEGEEYAKHLMQAGVLTIAQRMLGARHGVTEQNDLPQSLESQEFLIRAMKLFLENDIRNIK